VDSGLTQYTAALDALFARTGSTAKFGLDRTFRFLRLLGNPQSRFDSFHVAGTNGKGSVVATLAALLEAKGHRVGRYMSPHLIDFRERITVNGHAVPEKYVTDFLDRWSADAEALGATFFEITTALAFHYFAESAVDVAVIETGLGGRLDSTNVIEPLVSGITSIGLDHQEYLGHTEEAIAREKAGIVKPHRPCVIGRLSSSARAAVLEIAALNDSEVIEAEEDYRVSNVSVSLDGTSFRVEHGGSSRELRTGLVGTAQAGNAAVAIAMLNAAGSRWSVSLDDAAGILPSVTLPGRFQRLGNMILDVAHNADGIRGVVDTLERVEHEPPVVALLGVLADKDWRAMLTELSRVAARVILVSPPSAPANRAWDPQEAKAFALDRGIHASVETDFALAIRDARATHGTVLVTGSFHTVGDALAEMGEKTL
jgi:dihydrofolate synthase/folylpolyglutamate synthase